MWLHRGCTGLSKSAFLLVTQSTDSFYYPHCHLDIQDKEISSLKDAIASLSKDLTVMKSLIDISSKSSDHTTASAPAPAPGTSDTYNIVDVLTHNIVQLVDTATHIKGNILDLVLVNSENIVSGVKVGSNLLVNSSSDHFLIFLLIAEITSATNHQVL